ncbi:MAG TPA: helix-turn-helix transcriptional regulator [Labilithrix sp.]|nr:helix-turn-helix transcriptional regulator [Labilithrix sp.]
MNKHDRSPPPPRGIVRAPAADGLLDGRRMLPGPALATYVHHFWSVRWALRAPFVADTLPHPSAQITLVSAARRPRAAVTGVHRGRVAGRLEGEGWKFGITFRPAMFQPLLGASMTTITDRVVPLDEVLGPNAKIAAWTRAIAEARELEEKIAIAEAFLGPRLGPLPPTVVRLRDLVERMAGDRSILRVEDVCQASLLDVRALQRAFRTYVGVSPKWVIQRYRLHEAAAQLSRPQPPELAALAASLGYADQAHFTRDFKRMVGETPRSFADLR